MCYRFRQDPRVLRVLFMDLVDKIHRPESAAAYNIIPYPKEKVKMMAYNKHVFSADQVAKSAVPLTIGNA